MRKTPYTYTVIKYLHDPASGEMLNIGVILCAPEAGFIDARLEYHHQRLSETFVNFDGEHYRQTLRRFMAGLDALRDRVTPETLFDLVDRPSDARRFGDIVWPDTDLSFQLSPVMAGITEDPALAIEAIFHRMVTSQYARKTTQARTDDDVWAIYQPSLVRRKIVRNLRPTVIQTTKVELKFEHAFKNEKWHVLQPMSMDYVRKEYIQNKAARWLGNGIGLQESPEIGCLYILFGPPQIEAHKAAYTRAKNLLHEMPVRHEFIEEDAAEQFADFIKSYMRDHGVVSGDEE
jgi:hypothetical protein